MHSARHLNVPCCSTVRCVYQIFMTALHLSDSTHGSFVELMPYGQGFRHLVKHDVHQEDGSIAGALSVIAEGRAMNGSVVRRETWGVQNICDAVFNDGNVPPEFCDGTQQCAAIVMQHMLQCLPSVLANCWRVIKMDATGQLRDVTYMQHVVTFQSNAGRDLFSNSRMTGHNISEMVADSTQKLPSGFFGKAFAFNGLEIEGVP